MKKEINCSEGNVGNDVLTMVFINMQPLDEIYTPEAAFNEGTLFPNLNKPFLGGMK